jgi:CRP/FNR family transcriptional regulator, cyclic AMP receptor protein
MPPLTDTIGKVDFFAGVDRKLLKKMAESAVVCDYEKGEVIVREGETGLGMYVILRGRVRITKDKAGAPVRLEDLGPEQFFAEMSLIDEKPRSATVTTVEETECLLFTRDSFLRLMSHNPQLAIQLARSLAERLRKTDDVSRTAPVQALASSLPPAAAMNGTGGSGVKAAIQEKLLSLFERLYTAKAFTRFSVALLGCPVEGTAANLIEEIRVGDVKVLIFPAGEPVEVQIQAYGAGSFNLHVFTPEESSPVRFDPVAILPGDRFVLNLPGMSLSCGSRRARTWRPRERRAASAGVVSRNNQVHAASAASGTASEKRG